SDTLAAVPFKKYSPISTIHPAYILLELDTYKGRVFLPFFQPKAFFSAWMNAAFSCGKPIETRSHCGKPYPPTGRTITPCFSKARLMRAPAPSSLPTRTSTKLPQDGTYSR